MLSFLRAPMPARTNTSSQKTIQYEDGRASATFHGAGSDYFFTCRLPPTTAEHGVTLLQPPLHYHVSQDEYFRVQSGTARFLLGVSQQAVLRDASNPKAHVPPRVRHRFENASSTEDLVLDVLLTPQDALVEERFFRNLFQYLSDCKKAGMEPSVFQLMVLLHSVGAPAALVAPFGSEVAGLWLGRAFTAAMAGVGRLLGYKESYEEYFSEKKGL